MKDEVVIICPEIAPGSGGLADYTLRVVEQWNGKFPLRFIVPAAEEKSPAVLPSEFNVDVTERSRAALREKLPARGGKVLLQYSAYGFDHFGYPRWLLQTLADWKSSSGGLLAVMLHEIWTFWPVLNRNYLIQQLHRRDLRVLIGCADAVLTSTDNQAGHLRELEPATVVHVLPVGSNVRPRGGANREPGLAVLFGLQGVRLRALQAMEAELKALASASLLTKVVTIGGANTADGNQEEQRILSTLPLSEGAEQEGTLAEMEISSWLARASFGISAQDELSLTKSGTFMAYAAHGLNILSPCADTAKSEPLPWLTRPAELLRGLSPDVLTGRAGKLRAWQERTSSWPVIADRFAAALSA